MSVQEELAKLARAFPPSAREEPSSSAREHLWQGPLPLVIEQIKDKLATGWWYVLNLVKLVASLGDDLDPTDQYLGTRLNV